MPNRLVYYFGNGAAEGGREDKSLLGGKGANLAEMTRIGIPVPPGFTLTTEVCRSYLRDNRYPDGLTAQVGDAVRRLEGETGKAFGGSVNPLLVSVRSGASVSMPGMMETILNLGLNDRTVAALATASDDERFAYDSYRRFVQMYSDVVLGVPSKIFETAISARKTSRGVTLDTDLSAQDWKDLVEEFKALVRTHAGEPFPDDPEEQLWGAIEAVFRSWNVDRAIAYRRLNGIPDYLGTAVNIVAMVYGNMGDDSGTGVAFTRDPSTGERMFFGEFLVNAQGEDVVAGTRTPLEIAQMADLLPGAYEQLMLVQHTLEQHFREMQDLEFTVERGRLYLLQTRTGKRTARAAIKVAVDMVEEGLIDMHEAVLRVDPQQLDQLLHPRLDPTAIVTLLVTGLPASPGAASGHAVFDPGVAAERGGRGEQVILMREETSPDDFHGMVAAQAVVTSRGGMTSHAAVVARGMGKCCVVGATALDIEEDAGYCSANGQTVREDDWVTVDGTTGRVLIGHVATCEPEMTPEFHVLMAWADSARRLRVRANADTPQDAKNAREFGAEGIGLCRTEHMFFDSDRIQAVREMILASDSEARERALAKLLPMQREDFIGIFRAMDGLPVTIRLLDPPLHEFLPRTQDELMLFARNAGVPESTVTHMVERHREANPMLGHRGVRLGLSHPEITEMQTRAIFEAAVAATNEGVVVLPEVMVPLVATERELQRQREVIDRIAGEVMTAAGVTIPYQVGTMIELPRAALLAGEIATYADFFSFGTNDLTQTALGISRDDAGSFLPAYVEAGIFEDDPFQVLDIEGVGQLVQMATWEGRKRRHGLKVGICGEHGGDPRSIQFFHETGLDYVSCSPFRVPVARLAAAHAQLHTQGSVRTEADARSRKAESRTAEATLHRPRTTGIIATLAVGASLLLGACARPVPHMAPQPVAAVKQVRVLATNDVHGHLVAEPASWAGGRPAGGSAAFAAYVARERASFPGPTIVLDGGDIMQGTPISNLTNGRSTIDAFNAIGYTAAAIGNHEFDWGTAVLRDRIKQANFPLLSANIHVAGSDTAPSWVQESAVIQIDGVRIGIIGLSTESTPQTTHASNVEGLTFGDGAAALDRWVPVLRNAGVDFVIAVAHSGASCDTGFTNCRGEIVDWATRTTARPDLIVAGHTHAIVQTVVNRIPIIEAGSYGSRYGVVDLRRITADSVDAQIRGVFPVLGDSVTAVPAVAAVVERHRIEIGPEVERVIGMATAIVARGEGENAMGRLVADGQRWRTGAQIALMNSGGIRSEIDAGPITWSEAYQVHPFGNRLVVLKLKGSSVRAALEHAVSRGSVMLQVSGITAAFDRSRPSGSRVTSITLLDGTPIRDDVVYDVVANDFIANGIGDGFTSLGEALSSNSTGILDLDALLEYVKYLGTVTPSTERRLRSVDGQ